MRHSRTNPRMLMQKCRLHGFTLIEVLATLLILAIALPSVVYLVLGNARAGHAATERNLAALVITEAIADIERIHLITKDVAADPADEGLYIETVPDPTAPNIHLPPYNAIRAGNQPLTDYIGPRMQGDNPGTMNTMVWPPRQDSPRYGGGIIDRASSVDTRIAQGAPIRVIYELRHHPEWTANPDSGYAGTYILTLAVYRDLTPKDNAPGDTSNFKRYQQITDPVVVYLGSKGGTL